MTIREYEAKILAEARKVIKKKTLKMSDILYWGAGHVKPGTGEMTYFLKEMQVTILVKQPKTRKKKAAK